MAVASASGYSSNWIPSQEPPCAAGVALKGQKTKKKKIIIIKVGWHPQQNIIKWQNFNNPDRGKSMGRNQKY